jgi:ADP-ribose pyrophosphatase YjhB (NUDIX family)
MAVRYVTVTSLEHAVRAAWCLWTSDPVDQPGWTDANPASGQCASTALVVQDRLGGELLMADVHEADGSRQGVHYWNRLPDGTEFDLTREQFRRGEVVGTPQEVDRPPDVTRGRLAGYYHLLAHRVAAPPRSTTVTVKGVCRRADGRVLVCRNDRGEWELPGGRPEVGELFQDCVRREIREETGLDVAVTRVLGVRAFEVVPGRWVDVVGYACRAPDAPEPRPSGEHTEVGFVDAELPAAYAELLDLDVLGEWHVGG